MSNTTAGIPIKLLYEAESMKITVEVCYCALLTLPLICLFLILLSLDEKWGNLSWDATWG